MPLQEGQVHSAAACADTDSADAGSSPYSLLQHVKQYFFWQLFFSLLPPRAAGIERGALDEFAQNRSWDATLLTLHWWHDEGCTNPSGLVSSAMSAGPLAADPDAAAAAATRGTTMGGGSAALAVWCERFLCEPCTEDERTEEEEEPPAELVPEEEELLVTTLLLASLL